MAERSVGQSENLFAFAARLVQWIKYSLPEGRPLPTEIWHQRHHGIIVLLWLHAIGIAIFAMLTEYDLTHSLMEGAIVGFFATVAQFNRLSRRIRSSIASLGLITASGVLVHLSGGYIEMHFHFFVMLIVISLYQDWVPFLLTIGYVVIHHGTLGVLFPTSVYNHPDAWAHPWKWALIHGTFVLGASIASLINWRLNEHMRVRTELLLHSVGEGIYGIDHHGRTAFVNPIAAQLLGHLPADIIGQPIDELLRTPNQADQPDVRASMLRAIHEGVAEQRGTTCLVRRDGITFPIEYVCRPMHERNRVIGAVLTFQDIRQRIQEEAEKLAYLEERKRAQEQIIQLQQLHIVNLSTPLIPLSNQVMVMPLVGGVDAERCDQILTQLLRSIETNQTRIAILDITGVSFIDAQMGHMLIRAAQMVRLLGAEFILTGIGPEVAQTLVGLNIDLQNVVTASTLQEAIAYALK